MADANVVGQALDLLPTEAKIGDTPWDQERVTTLLDEGNSVNKLMSRFWHAKAAETAAYIDVSESGSSRSLSTVHENAVRMARYWDDRVKADEDAAQEASTTRIRATTHRARRV